MKNFIIGGSIIFASVSYSAIRTSTSLFDTPTAYVNRGLFSEVTLGMTTTPLVQLVDSEIHLMLSLFDRIELSLSPYSIRPLNISPSIKCDLIQDTRSLPAISVGVLNLDITPDIPSVWKIEDTLWRLDTLYLVLYRRVPEPNSIFIVSTKDLGHWGRYNIGFGRLGMFWGADIGLGHGIRTGLEFDGREFNLGFRFKGENLKIWLLLRSERVKAELMREGSEERLHTWKGLMPLINLSLAINVELLGWLRRPVPGVGAIVGRVVDRETGEPLSAIVEIERATSVATDKYGYYRSRLAAGVYIIRVFAEGYHSEHKKVYVKAGMQSISHFTLRKR